MNAEQPERKSAEFWPVKHNEAAHRYEIELPGALAVIEYHVANGYITYTHTFVPPEFRGRGLAERLVRRALDDARDQPTKVIPACSYVATFIRRHPEYQRLLTR